MEDKTLTVRVSAELFDKVRELAEAERRSLSAQVVVILEQFFRKGSKG